MPLLSLGDISHLRVRAEIDESDIAKLRLGQRAYVKAAAFGDRRFWGHVIRIGESLGQKRVRTTRAAEKTDRDILETLIELDETGVLPVGVRVDVYIAKGQP
jgi:multidrug resistance efflux pump